MQTTLLDTSIEITGQCAKQCYDKSYFYSSSDDSPPAELLSSSSSIAAQGRSTTIWESVTLWCLATFLPAPVVYSAILSELILILHKIKGQKSRNVESWELKLIDLLLLSIYSIFTFSHFISLLLCWCIYDMQNKRARQAEYLSTFSKSWYIVSYWMLMMENKTLLH